MTDPCQKLAAILEWEKANFPCVTQMEMDARDHRARRRAELLRLLLEDGPLTASSGFFLAALNE